MKELFSEPDFSLVGYYKSVLDSAGIPALIKNEHINGNDNEITLPELFPSLWVVNDEDHKRALQLIVDHLQEDDAKAETEIECASCGESNPGNFEVCWSCGGKVAG